VAAPDPVGGPGGAVPVQGNAATGGPRSVDGDGGTETDHQGVMPIEDSAQAQAIAPR